MIYCVHYLRALAGQLEVAGYQASSEYTSAARKALREGSTRQRKRENIKGPVLAIEVMLR